MRPDQRISAMRCIILIFISVMAWQSVSGSSMRLFGNDDIGARMIYSITQDVNGFLWVGTDYGLRRFDGTRFKSYLHSESDPASLNENTILKVVASGSGNLWVATEDGLHVYDPAEDSFHLIEPEGLDTHGYISDVVLDDDGGGAWFIVGGMGLYHVDGGELSAKGPYLKNVGRMIMCRDGNIWMSSSQESKVLRFNTVNDSVKTYDGYDGFFINIAKTVQDTPVLVTTSDIYVYDERNDTFFAADRSCLNKRLSFNDAWCNDHEGTLLVSTSEGLVGMSSDFVLKEMDDAVGRDKLTGLYRKPTALLCDGGSCIWIGNEDGSLEMLSESVDPFRYIGLDNVSQSNTNDMVSAIAAGSGNDVLIALKNKEILYYRYNEGIAWRIKTQGVPSAVVFDKIDRVYGWEDGVGLCAYGLDTGCRRVLYPFAKSRSSTGAVFDRQGNLYVAVDGCGLLVCDVADNECQWLESGSSKLVNNWISSLHMGSGDDMWIGYSGGLGRMNTVTREFAEEPDYEWLKHVKCYSFDIDGRNDVWIGTSRGLCRLDPATDEIVRYSTSDGLSDEIVCSVSADQYGNIWCSTPNGLNRLDVATGTVTNFYGGKGIVDNFFGRGLGFKTDAGLICFAGYSGMTVFDPMDINSDSLCSNVMISDLVINGRSVNAAMISGNRRILDSPIYDADDIYVSHDDNSLSLFLSMSGFYNSENCCYEYWLTGHGEMWHRLPIGESVLSYHNLSPGDYELHIRARENGEVSPEKVIKIHVAAAWYSSNVAKLIYVILVIIVVTLVVVLLRRRQKDEINEAKLRYFTNISHDIRSPLTLILSPLETLMKNCKDESDSSLMRVMHLNTMKIKSLIDQMLDIRKLDSGKLKLYFAHTEMVQYTKDLIEIFKFQADYRHIDLSLTSDFQEVYAWIDVDNMDKVLVNLISNAFKYTNDGGSINIDISEGVSERASIGNPLSRYVKITVSDTGSGLRESELSKIFDRFYQSHTNNTNTIGSGSGLGLNLCKMLVELHHGKIYASNRTDVAGCVFTILLPKGREHLNDDEIESYTGIRRQILSHSFYPVDSGGKCVRNVSKHLEYKILIVDDSEEVVNYLSSQLGTRFRIITADNGNAALELTVKCQPDLIISDLIMPELGGLELLQRLKSNVETNHIPFIIISTLDTVENKIRGLKYGADGYIGKPFVMSEILAVIDNLISNRQRLKGKYSGVQEQNGKVRDVKLLDNETALMDKIMQIVNENLDNQDFSVDMLCREVGISRSHLHRRMRQYAGISASDFIRNIRLKKASELLKNKDVDISQIAYAVGFGNTGYFATAFKRHYGITPTDYRNRDM